MQIKNVKQLIKYRNYLLKLLKLKYIELDKLGKNPFSNIKEKRKLRDTLEEINYNLDDIKRFLYTSTCFKSSEFYEFAEKFLVLTEPNYTITKFKVANPYADETLSEKIIRNIYWKKGKRLNSVKGKWCYAISDRSTRKYILKNIFDEDDLDEYKYDKKSDVIIIDEFYTHPFEKYMMKEEFRKHKKLKTAIYELINLKIKHPELTDEERFEKVLQNTIRRNLNKSYGYQKKKISR